MSALDNPLPLTAGVFYGRPLITKIIGLTCIIFGQMFRWTVDCFQFVVLGYFVQ